MSYFIKTKNNFHSENIQKSAAKLALHFENARRVSLFKFIIHRSSFIILLTFFALSSFAQRQDKLHFFEIPDTLNKARFWALNGSIAAGYTGTMALLNVAWYKGYERSSFHFFNDMGEWEDMDKAGHFFSTYFESKWTSSLYRWTGVKERKAAYMGAIGGFVFQGGIEVLDGFSEKWGASAWDIVFNTAGAMTFLGQELLWEEQRISVKFSAHKPKYSTTPIQANNSMATTTIRERADALYGTSLAEIALKDYNGLTIWVSGNISAFIRKEDHKFPKWLNLAVGYSAENVYGGFGNGWSVGEDNYRLSDELYPRYRQFLLAPDVDFTRIPTKSKGLKILFGILNIIKIPAPALEVNSLGKLKFHPVYF